MDEAEVGAAGTPDHRAFLEATLPHLDALYRVARHASDDRFAAEDLVQETYLRAYAAFGTHTGPSTRAWLVTICLNLARSSWRRRQRRPLDEPVADLDAYLRRARPAPPEDEPFGVVQEKLDREAVTEALGQLSEEQRLAIVLMDLSGHSASEVAEMLGCPRGTVLARAHRGKRRLAQLLTDRGFDRGLR